MPNSNQPETSAPRSSFDDEAHFRPLARLMEDCPVGSRQGKRAARVAKNIGALAILGAGLIFAPPSANAQTTWTGGNASWDTPANWTPGLQTPTAGIVAINNNGVVSVGSGVTGSYGQLYVGNIAGGAGTIEVREGTFTGNGSTYLGHHALGSGTAIMTGGNWASSSAFEIGYGGQGVLEMSGGSLSSSSATLGYDTPTNGSASITGGTWSITNNLLVSYLGTGSMVINGGNVSVGKISFVGHGRTGVGSLTVSSGTLSQAALTVGQLGTGTLTVNGGHVVSTGTVTIASNALANGTLAISSGTFETSNTFFIGYSGTASMTVSGGAVTTGSSTFGYNTGSKAVATLTGGTWVSSDMMAVGRSGSASLAVNGGLLTTTGLSIASEATGSGTVAVSSGTLNVTTSALTVANKGKGTLNISGGMVTAQSIIVTGSSAANGTLNLSGNAVLEATQIQKGNTSGTASVVLDGGLLRAKATSNAFISNFKAGEVVFGNSGAFIDSNGFDISITSSVSGSGGLTKQGAGTLTLSASNSYSGGTVVDGGDIIVSANHALGTSGIDLKSSTLTVQAGIDSDISLTSFVNGSGGLIKQGVGALTLSASNSYSGGTVIEAGRVVADANHALGTGAVTVKSGTLTVQTGVNFDNVVTLEGGSFGRGISSGASLTNAIDLTGSLGGVTTRARIAGGTSSGTVSLEGSFSANSSAINDGIRVGNVFHLSGVSVLNGGTGETDIFVLEITVANIAEGNILGWLDTETNQWVNAINGNIGGTATNLGDKAYNAHTDFVLGYYGFDGSKGTVWAVINHNSDFAAIPEPGTWALLLFGGSALLGWKKRRSGSRVM